MNKWCVILCALVVWVDLLSTMQGAVDGLGVRVCPIGVPGKSDDSGGIDGSRSFTSVKDALVYIRRLRADGRIGQTDWVEVRLSSGIYRIWDPILFGPEDHDVGIVADGQGVVIDGGFELAPFVAETNGFWRTALPAGCSEPEQLYVNGRRASVARSPNIGYFFMEGCVLDDAYRSFYAAPGDLLPLAGLSREDISRVVVRAYHSWESTEMPVVAVDVCAGIVTT